MIVGDGHRYLRVIIVDRLTLEDHFEFVSGMASVTQGALARIVPNTGRPNKLKIRKIVKMIILIMLYASAIWEKAWKNPW